jgi:hypothetical protein
MHMSGGAFTVRVRMLNHMDLEQSAWGEEIAATFDMASIMVGSLADQFSIPKEFVSIKIVMRRFKDGTFTNLPLLHRMECIIIRCGIPGRLQGWEASHGSSFSGGFPAISRCHKRSMSDLSMTEASRKLRMKGRLCTSAR